MVRKICFIWDPGNWPGAESYPKANSPPLTISGQENLQMEGGLHAETVQSALTVILKLVIGGVTSVILVILSTVNLSSRSVCSHFIKANSWNCGSLCYGYSLVISLVIIQLNFFHLVGVLVSIRQLTGYDSP